MVHFGIFWPEEVHFGPFRSANRTLAISYLVLQASNSFLRRFRQEWCISAFTLFTKKLPLLISSQHNVLGQCWLWKNNPEAPTAILKCCIWSRRSSSVNSFDFSEANFAGSLAGILRDFSDPQNIGGGQTCNN